MKNKPQFFLVITFAIFAFFARPLAAQSTRIEIETNHIESVITRVKPVTLTPAQLDQFIATVNHGQPGGITSANIQRIVIVRHEEGTNVYFTANVTIK